MKKKSMGIRETGTTFVTGEVFSPSWDDAKAIVAKMYNLGLVLDLVPEIKISVILAHRGAFNRTIPTLLMRADMKDYKTKAPFAVQGMLWVLACYGYKWSGLPYPGTIKRHRYPKRGAVLEFRCPMCGRDIFEPNKRFKSRRVLIEQYANALHRHSQDCDDILYLDRRVK